VVLWSSRITYTCISPPLCVAYCAANSNMSVLPAEIHSALAHILQALQSPDNNVRTQAEDQLHTDWTAGRPDILLMGLVEQIQGSQEPAVRRKAKFGSPQGLTPFRRHDPSQPFCFVESRRKPARILPPWSRPSFSYPLAKNRERPSDRSYWLASQRNKDHP
jgi:hypothetical protein